MAINKKIIFVWLVFFVIVSINVNGFDITIDTIIDGSMINTNSTWLNITTDKYAVCQYKLNSDPYLGFSSTDVGYWKAGSSYNKLEISEKLNPPETNIEQIINITEFIGKNELNGLADRSITNDKGTFDYNQSLYFDNSHQTGYVIYTEDDNDVTSDFLYFKSGEQIARYNLEFNTPFESDVEDSNGNTDTTGLYLGDYKNKKIKILGKEYEIVKARRVTATGNDIDLTLMRGTIKGTLQEGETKTYTINDKDYEVTVTGITDTGTIVAKFVVNGETTSSLQIGSSFRLLDGIEIGVVDLLPNEAGDVTQDSVSFYLDAERIYLKDTDISDKASSNTLEVGSENIDNAYIFIEGSDDNNTLRITNIQINTTADDDFYVPAGGRLSSQMDEPQALFTQNWDILYKGLSSETTKDIKIKTSGADQYELEFTDGDGYQATIPILYTESGSIIRFGDDDDLLILNESHKIAKNDYFIISDYSQDAGRRTSFALRYKGADRSNVDNPVIKFDLMGAGERIERTYLAQDDSTADATINLGGQTFNVYNASADTSSDFNILVDLDSDGDYKGDNIVAITTKYGAEISLDNQTYDKALNITITTPNTNDWENLTPTELQFNATAIGGEVRLAELSNLKLMAPQDNPTHSYGYTSYGTFINYYQPTDDPQTLTIDYPENQLEALAYFENGGSHTRYLTNLGNGTYNLNLTCEDIFNGTHNKSIIFHVDISELMDSDDDGINDPYDYLIGNISSINSTISNINMSINSSDNFTKMFNSSFLVNITNGTNNLVDFTYNFSQSCPLNLSNITINTEIVNNKGALTITGINPSCVVGTKTIYVDDINTNSVVCVHDAEIVSVSEIAAQCNGADETIVACTTNGHTQGGYTCTDLGDKLRIEGLTHSGVQQMNCTDNDRDGYGTGCSSGSDCNDDDASKTANCGSNGGGGGGGGGSSTKITCAESWSCTAWQPTLCPETSRQTRQCTDSTNCGTIANKPSESRGCYYPKPKEEVKEEEIVEEIKEEVKAKSVEPEKERGLLAITGNFILDGLKKGSKTTGVITIAGIVVLGLAGYIFIKKKF